MYNGQAAIQKQTKRIVLGYIITKTRGLKVIESTLLRMWGCLDESTANGFLDLLVHQLADEAESGMAAQEVDRTGSVGLCRRQHDGRGCSLDTLVVLVLGVDAKTNKLRSRDVANEQLGVFEVVLDVLGHLEGDQGRTFLNLVRVDDVRIATGEGAVETDVCTEVGKGKTDRIVILAERNAGDGMHLHHTVQLVLVHEEPDDPEHDDKRQKPPNDPASAASLLVFLAFSAIATESLPEAGALASRSSSYSELLVVLVDTIDGKLRLNGFLVVGRIF